jgi:hypothetical protein
LQRESELDTRTEYRYEKVGSPNLPNGPKTGVQSDEKWEELESLRDRISETLKNKSGKEN